MAHSNEPTLKELRQIAEDLTEDISLFGSTEEKIKKLEAITFQLKRREVEENND